ncbi:SMI1/KNR4 family protein [Sutcliffiella horikoshii]|uniref:SMI1/KNR4 family protein n=1 Tax=Sutcliffiella horikoshii TaxID=79883 RepID=A0AA94WSA4_9BACI|nr:SMI1/KNR4 family protein [Sutcliffiella horikoshii]TYS59879.1 SMI1/KNR4 family protein [Sutcliffiella horikoshii]
MDCKELSTFINDYKETDDFTGGVDKAQITLVQNELGVKLPESFKWFLSNYGSGGMFGVDIQGVGKSNRPSVVVNTKRYRDLGLKNDLVVIENSGEYAYCLYTSNMENNECPIIAWNRVGGLDDYYTAKNFYEFLSQRLLDAKESWEEDF